MQTTGDRYATVTRIIRMLELIPPHPRKVTAVEIANALREKHEFNVNRRTLERDLVALSGPFHFAFDDHKPRGYYYPEGAKRTFLSSALDPHASLTMQLVHEYLAELLPPATLSAIDPLVEEGKAVLEGVRGSRLRRWPRKVAVVDTERPRFLPPKVSKEVHDTVYRAILEERMLEVEYQKRGETEARTFRLAPWGLVQATRVTYIVGARPNEKGTRHFSLHRLRRATLLDDPARIPSDFDLRRYVEEEGNFRYVVSTKPLRLRAWFPDGPPVFAEETPLGEDQTIHMRKGGGYLLTVTVPDSAQIRWWLRGLGSHVVVLAPKSLRAEMEKDALVTIERYRNATE